MKHFLYLAVLLTFAGVGFGRRHPHRRRLELINESVGNLVEVDVTIFGLPTTLDSYQFDVNFTSKCSLGDG